MNPEDSLEKTVGKSHWQHAVLGDVLTIGTLLAFLLPEVTFRFLNEETNEKVGVGIKHALESEW